MAYEITTASSYLTGTNISGLTAEFPVTLSVWFKPNAAPTLTNRYIFGVYSSNDANGFGVGYNSSVARSYIRSNNTQDVADSAAGVTMFSGQWYNISTVFTTATSRICYLNGVAGTNATTAIDTFTTAFDRVVFFTRPSVSAGIQLMELGEAAIWTAALDADEISSLAKGLKATKIRPQSLKFYAPLDGQLTNLAGSDQMTFTESGTVQKSDSITEPKHPRRYG